MLDVDTEFQERLVAQDLLSAAHAMQDSLRRLFYCYDRANKIFTGEAGQPDPATIHRGLVAASYGVKMLVRWLRELEDIGAMRYVKEANEISAWMEEWFYARDLPMELPDEA